jgi:hypothetical protein
MRRAVSIVPVSHRLKAPFRISRGVKTAAEVVVAQVDEDGLTGRGESVPYARYGETVDSVLAQLRPAVETWRDGATPHETLALLPAGSCAFADLDGPWWLAEDHPGGARVADGRLSRPRPGFWGDGTTAQGLWL